MALTRDTLAEFSKELYRRYTEHEITVEEFAAAMEDIALLTRKVHS